MKGRDEQNLFRLSVVKLCSEPIVELFRMVAKQSSSGFTLVTNEGKFDRERESKNHNEQKKQQNTKSVLVKVDTFE